MSSQHKNSLFRRAAVRVLVRALPHAPNALIRSYLNRSTKDIAAPSSGEFLGKLFTELRRRWSTFSPNCRTRLVENMASQFLLCGDVRREVKEEAGSNPDLVVISPTMRCNLKCTGCYSANYDRRDALSTADFDNVIQQVKDLGIRFVVISGGEPFIREDYLDIAEKHSDVIFMTYTNGTLIADRDLAPRLARLGNIIPCISVEGFEKETRDRRGPGVWERILLTMDSLKKEGVIFGFSGTPTRLNNELLVSDEFIDFFVDRGCLIGWLFSYMPVGRSPDVDLMPTPEQRLHRMNRIREIRKTKHIVAADFWCDGNMTDGCLSAGKVYLHINAEGGIEPCVFNQFWVDNIKQVPLRKAIGSEYFRYLRQRLSEGDNKYRPCPVVDRPQILRDACARFRPRPSQPGGEKILDTLAPAIDGYASELKVIMDKKWSHDFPGRACREDCHHIGPGCPAQAVGQAAAEASAEQGRT